MQTKVSIIIPVYNEASAICDTLERVYSAPLGDQYYKEVVIVDDGSTDATVKEIRAYIEKNNHAKSITKFHSGLVNHGKGAALRAGFKLATGDIFVIQDADLEYDPSDYTKLLKPFEYKGVDIVFGSRFINGWPKGMEKPNLIANLILTFTVRLMYRQRITDEATGYKVFRRKVLLDLNLKCRRFEFCPEFTSQVLKKGYRINEVPISYNPRSITEGKKIRASDGFVAIWWLLKEKFSFHAKRLEKTAVKHV